MNVAHPALLRFRGYNVTLSAFADTTGSPASVHMDGARQGQSAKADIALSQQRFQPPGAGTAYPSLGLTTA